MREKQQRKSAPALFLGEFTLDPSSEEFRDLRSVCEPGNPYRCLIGTAASIHIGKRLTARLDHSRSSGVIGVTHADMRYERPMTPEEFMFAAKFDLGARMRKPVTVIIDLADGTWKTKPKQKAYGLAKDTTRRINRKGDGVKRTIRMRQLEAIKKAHAQQQEAAQAEEEETL